LWVGIVILPVVAAVVLGCRSGRPELIFASDRPASRIFEGFAFVGDFIPRRGFVSHTNRLSPYRLHVERLPAEFVEGHEFYFHHSSSDNDGMRIAQEVLAARIRNEGYTVTERGVNGIFVHGFATFCGRYSFTTYGIQFKREGCVADLWYDNDQDIRSNPWPVVSHTWDPADYILRVQGTCGL
jgi:hypothetical protein